MNKTNNKDKGSLFVRWGMLLHCGLPLLILIILGFNGVNIPTSTWILMVATLVVFNVLMRRKHR